MENLSPLHLLGLKSGMSSYVKMREGSPLYLRFSKKRSKVVQLQLSGMLKKNRQEKLVSPMKRSS